MRHAKSRPPATPEVLELFAADPYEPTRALYLLVRPRGHMPAGFRIVQHSSAGEDPVELLPSSCVSFQPTVKVRQAGEQVALTAVANVVRKHKVVA
jgi:hypothetical protein